MTVPSFENCAYPTSQVKETSFQRDAPIALSKRKTEFERLKASRIELTDAERDRVMSSGATWHHGPNGEETPAVWKAVLGERVVYVTNTHRAYNTAPTLKGAISRYHNFIKGTA